MKAIRLIRRSALLTFACAAALLAIVPVAARAYTDVSVRIDIGNAPPPPRFRFYAPPREVYVMDRVYLVEDPAFGDVDCFRYGGYYWIFNDGYWYRSPSWRSRFVVVSPRYVPTVIYNVPARHWKHHPNGPPARARYTSGPSGRRGGPAVHSGGRGNAGHGDRDQGNRGGKGKGGGGGKGHGGHGK